MATTTTYYGFDIPQSSDLVKDGATAIATLGQDIDTAMNTALGTKKSGLVLLNTTSFTNVTSQSFNNVFSANYDNYRIMFNNIINVSVSGAIALRLRSSGTDNSSNNYMRQYASFNSTTVSAARATNQTSWGEICYTNTGNDQNAWIDIYSPFNTQYTNALQMGNSSGSGNVLFINQAYGVNVTTSYDGFTVINSQSMTGSVSVYGYNK